MSKVDTDQGLGPGSERLRRELAGVKEEKRAVAKSAETQPGVGKVQKRADTVDDLLDGFGSSRPDMPRILPNADTTPPPEPLKKELTPTAPGARQRKRRTILALVAAFGAIAVLGVAFVKLGSSSSVAQPTATATTTTTTPTSTTPTATATAASTETTPMIATTSVESLPTVKTVATTTGRPVHSASTSATATATPTATATAHPTGSAPPGLNLFPDDPHR